MLPLTRKSLTKIVTSKDGLTHFLFLYRKILKYLHLSPHYKESSKKKPLTGVSKTKQKIRPNSSNQTAQSVRNLAILTNFRIPTTGISSPCAFNRKFLSSVNRTTFRYIVIGSPKKITINERISKKSY